MPPPLGSSHGKTGSGLRTHLAGVETEAPLVQPTICSWTGCCSLLWVPLAERMTSYHPLLGTFSHRGQRLNLGHCRQSRGDSPLVKCWCQGGSGPWHCLNGDLLPDHRPELFCDADGGWKGTEVNSFFATETLVGSGGYQALCWEQT